MRLVESDREEERPVAVHFEQLDRLGGVLPVGLILVGARGGEPACPLEFAAAEVASLTALTCRRYVEAAAVIPRLRVSEEHALAIRIQPRVDDFAQARGEVTLLAKKLRQSDDIGVPEPQPHGSAANDAVKMRSDERRMRMRFMRLTLMNRPESAILGRRVSSPLIPGGTDCRRTI